MVSVLVPFHVYSWLYLLTYAITVYLSAGERDTLITLQNADDDGYNNNNNNEEEESPRSAKLRQTPRADVDGAASSFWSWLHKHKRNRSQNC